ncbi:MAG: type II secretion system protein, partial [Verrucomicrobia bacterium]
MAQFSYKARRRSGEVVQGVLDVADRTAALTQIERLGLFPVAVEAAKGAAVAKAERAERRAASSAGFLPPALRALLNRQRKPRLQELATFTQQLANLLQSGMPLTVALTSMSHLESRGISPEVSKQLKQDVMEGRSLSDGMGRHPVIFSDMYVNMVRAGEQSGALVEVLRRVAEHYERFADVQSKFVSALVYPCIVACVGVLIIIFFMTFMLPRFMSIFQGMNASLPWSTRALMNFGGFFNKGTTWLFIGLSAFVLVILFLRFKSTQTGSRKLDSWKMTAPVVGKVVK